MIHYLVTREHPYTINEYLGDWGRALQPRFEIIFYDDLVRKKSLQRGVYIFSDLERLNSPYMELAQNTFDALSAAGGCVLVNDPGKVLRRRSMLDALYGAGKNPFRAHSVDGDLRVVRFPVFIRQDNEHDGAMTPLLHSRDQLSTALGSIRGRQISDDNLLVVEYCNTADASGVFRKFGAFRVAGQIIPRHILLGGSWLLKYPDRVDAATVEEEKIYLTSNPHRDRLLEIFEIAHIDYGRIDYSLRGDEIVTWEINTNPTISVEPQSLSSLRQQLQPLFMDNFAAAMVELDAVSGPDAITFATTTDLIRRCKLRGRDRAFAAAKKNLRRMGRGLKRALAGSGH
jgi:hypothetical protein